MMKMRSVRTVGLVLVAVCAAAPFALAKDDKKPVNMRQIIEAGHQKYSQAALAGDAKTLATVYAPKGSIFPPNAPAAQGRAAIEQFYTAMGKINIILSIGEIGQSGGSAWATGTYSVLGADGKPVDNGKFVEIWTETDSGWKIYKDIWNSDRPAVPPAAAPAVNAPAVKK